MQIEPSSSVSRGRPNFSLCGVKTRYTTYSKGVFVIIFSVIAGLLLPRGVSANDQSKCPPTSHSSRWRDGFIKRSTPVSQTPQGEHSAQLDVPSATMDFLRARAPYVAGLIGSGSLIVGLYSFVSPLDAIRVYGVRPSRHAATMTPKEAVSSGEAELLDEWTRTLAYAHGTRNTASGLASLVVTGLYYREPSPVAAKAIKRCLGMLVLVGSIVPIGDTLVTARYMAAHPLQQEDRDVAKAASAAHAARSVIWLMAGALGLWG